MIVSAEMTIVMTGPTTGAEGFLSRINRAYAIYLIGRFGVIVPGALVDQDYKKRWNGEYGK